jgi:hypothetical protein
VNLLFKLWQVNVVILDDLLVLVLVLGRCWCWAG